MSQHQSLSEIHASWKALRFFNLYRITLAGLFLVLVLTDAGPELLGKINPGLFIWATVFYVAFSLAASLASTHHWPAFPIQIYTQAAVDIVAITSLMHASGGVTSGLGMLLIPAIGGASLLLPGRIAVLFAALASLTLLADQIYSYWRGFYTTTAYTQTGILGATLFAAAIIAVTLARRARESEELAIKRGIDLANLSELNEHIIERMQSGIIVADDNGDIRLINEAAWVLLGNPHSDNPYRLADLSPALSQEHQSWLTQPKSGSQLLAKEESSHGELQVRFTRLGTSDTLATMIFLEDTAELTKRMQELKLASLGRLTASIAHEIRNPLGAISHAAQLMGESPDVTEADKRLVQIINDQSKRMNEIIHDVLRLSRRDMPHTEALALKPWLEAFVEEFCRHQELNPKQIALHIEPEDTLVSFDRGQLHQVLWNLCSNALKYGTASPQQLRLEINGGHMRESRYPYLDVIDHGPGIGPEAQGQLFEPFFTTSSTGTGLGLYITRELCENNGAHIDYIPIPTGGSCFRIEFAATEANAETA